MTNNASVTNVITHKKRKTASLEKKKARLGWVFVLPFVIGLVFVYFPIIYQSIRASLVSTERILGKQTEVFHGWNAYSTALFATVDSQDFLEVLITGVGDLVLDIPMILFFSLFMAILLNQKMAGRAAFRAIFFVPVILSTGIMSSLDTGTLEGYMNDGSSINTGAGTEEEGLVSALDMANLFSGLGNVGMEGMLQYVADIINRIFDIVNRSGVQMLIFLAGLQSISPAIYESVQIDGASAWETFWKITFPMISPMILVNAIYTVIDSFTSENAIMRYISRAQSVQFEYPIGADKMQQVNATTISSAMSWIYFLVVIAMLGLIAALCSTYVFYQKKK